MLHPRKIVAWTRTKGSIVTSATEFFSEDLRSSGHSRSTFYHPVIEFSYAVEGQEYHGSSTSSSISVSRTKAWADAEAARYMAGMSVDV